MRLVQEPAFSPIAIILETAAEAELFWEIIREAPCYHLRDDQRKMCNDMSDLFSNEAKL